MKRRRRDDPYYVRSALVSLAFYAGLLVLLFGLGWLLGWYALAGLGALLLWLYRGTLFGLSKWPTPLDVEKLIEQERARTRTAERTLDSK